MDLQDPDNINNLTCMSYIEKRLQDYNGLIKKCMEEGKIAPAQIKNKSKELMKQKCIITNQANSGQLKPEEYENYLKLQIKKDQNMLQYFVKNNDAKKAAIVKERIKIIQEELSGE